MLLGLFLDINARVLLLMILCFLAHEVVGSIDITWASRGRGIGPFEQRVHDFLTAIPFSALTLVALFKWRDLLLLVRDPVAALSQPLELRAPPLSPGGVTVILVLVVLCNIVPYVEEFTRAWRHRAGTIGRV